MKNHLNTQKPKLLVLMMALAFLSFSFISTRQTDKWVVPASAKNVKNPTKGDAENLAIAKSLYGQHCKSCHGKAGEGDGPKAAELDTFPGDFTAEEFHDQTDGEIFYKTTEGHGDMPSFKKKIPNDEDRWILIHYLRTLN